MKYFRKNARKRLIQERKRRMWSQQELADLLGTTQNTVSRWELGTTTPSPYFTKKIAAIFDKLPQDLGLLDDPLSSEHQNLAGTFQAVQAQPQTTK